jgi:hypothetical protein
MGADEPNGEPEGSLSGQEAKALASAVSTLYRGAFSVGRVGDQVQLAVGSGPLYAAQSTHGDSAAMLTTHLDALARRLAAGKPVPVWLRNQPPQSETVKLRAFRGVKLDPDP